MNERDPVSDSRFDEEYLGPDDSDFAEPNLTEDMRLGLAARALRESPQYAQVMRTMRGALAEGFRSTPMRDAQGLLYIRMLEQVIGDFDQLLADMVDTGRLSAEQLTALQQRFKGDE